MKNSSKLCFNQMLFIKWCVYFLTPLSTFWLASSSNMLTSNYTFLANNPPTKLFFFFWAIITLLTHTLLLNSLFKQLSISTTTIKYTVLTLVIAMILPYESGKSVLGFFHIFIGYIAFILYNYALYQLYGKCSLFNQTEISLIFKLYLLLLGACFSITMYYGSINGLVETLFSIFTPFLLFELKKKLP